MKRWHKRTLYSLTALSLVALALWLAAPSIVRREIHKRHPEVLFGALDLGLREVVLHDVTIDKGWIKAKADTARINVKTEAVHLVHGTIDVDLNKRPPHSGSARSEQPNVTAEDFNIRVEKSLDDENGSRVMLGSLNGVTIDDKTVKAAEGSFIYSRYQVSFGSLGTPLPAVEIARDLSHVKIGVLNFPEGLKLPESMPEIVHPDATAIDIDLEKRTASVNSVNFEMAEDQSVEVHVQWANLSLDGDLVHVRLDHLYVSHPWLAPQSDGPVDFENVDFEVDRDWKAPRDVVINGATLFVDPKEKSISGDESCATWVKALPTELAPGPLGGQTRWSDDHIKFSLGLLPKPHFALSGKCTATCTDTTIIELKHHFSYFTYNDKGERNETPRVTGPDQEDWVPLSQISTNMLEAVANTEDWGFWNHHGYVAAALEQSFLADVQSGKFSRGGSTITMQTAKNIFLSRDKTVGRKVSELFLSQALESCFSKKEILELYLNVVEFGPNIYGLRQAAEHYFKLPPMSLSAREAFYLACILPRPRHAPPPNAATMARMDVLMRMLAKAGRISDTMLLGVEEADTSDWKAP